MPIFPLTFLGLLGILWEKVVTSGVLFVTFRGHAYRSLDGKGRLMLPPEFRETIVAQDDQGRVMLTNFDGCVVGYPLPEWEEIEASFNKINMLNRKLRDFQRFFISGAVELTLDKQGRVLLPPHLRNYGRLNKDVVLAGVGRKFEIWDQAKFEETRQQMEDSVDEVMDELVQGGYELRI